MIRRHAALALAAALAVSPLLPAPAVASPAPAVASPTLTVASHVVTTTVTAAARPGTVAAAAKRYKNCTALNKAYAGGVARDAKAVNTKTVRGKKVKAASTYRPKVSKALYTANKGLDRDKDGIACER